MVVRDKRQFVSAPYLEVQGLGFLPSEADPTDQIVFRSVFKFPGRDFEDDYRYERVRLTCTCRKMWLVSKYMKP